MNDNTDPAHTWILFFLVLEVAKLGIFKLIFSKFNIVLNYTVPPPNISACLIL